MASANPESGQDKEKTGEEDSQPENGAKASQKRPCLSSKRKPKNTILNYFKKSPSKKSQKMEKEDSMPKKGKPLPQNFHEMEKEDDIPKKGKPLHQNFHEMSDGSSGEEADRPTKGPPSGPSRPAPKVVDDRPHKIRRHSSGRGWMRFSERDTAEYRLGYPKKKDYLNKKENKLFYTNKIPSRPRGALIEVILNDWYGDYDRLEQHHGYIQWLFPIREEGMNIESQDLQLHEAEAIKKDPEAHARVLKAYEMMLDFYGMRLKDRTTGELERADNWKDRYRNLRTMRHNYLRITRILKSLGELDYEHLKEPFVHFVLHEAVVERKLAPVLDSALDFWVCTIKEDAKRQELLDFAAQYVEDV